MARHPALAVSLYLGGRPVLVVGAGPDADERASRLEAAGAQVHRLAPSDYAAPACAGKALVVSHSGDPALDRRVAADARAARALAYAHDQPAASDLAFPALARRGPLSLTVATDGVAPAVAGRLRQELERLLAAAGTALDRLLAEYQHERAARPPGPDRARHLGHLARRLRLTGDIEVAARGETDRPEPPGDPDPTGEI